LRGRVIQSTGSWYQVETENGNIYSAKLRGRFKIKGIKSTNPIAVGDWVILEWDEKRETASIIKIEERTNYIVRRSVNLSKQSHIIAANIDQALVVVTISHPRTSTGFIDRFLVSCEAYHIPAILVFNKIDIYDKIEKEQLQQFVALYENIGYKCIEVSAKKRTNLEELKQMMSTKLSLISGHSGVGKSALINAMDNTKDIRIGAISDTHNKGKHTTTFAEMHKLSFGAHIIDSPGIKEFGLYDFDKSDLSHYFPDMREYMDDCKFNNCTHVHEPGCAVKQAIADGNIAESRYTNYLNMLAGKEMNTEEY
jgi:ribosome biogenesis GTPase